MLKKFLPAFNLYSDVVVSHLIKDPPKV